MRENNRECLIIIVVDDCEDIRLMLRFTLEMRGYCVLEAENGQVAVELVKQQCPDLILMDLDMPVLDGLAATRILRELEEMSDIPIIAVSANSKESYQTAACAAGCNEYLTKPVDFNELNHLLSRHLAA